MNDPLCPGVLVQGVFITDEKEQRAPRNSGARSEWTIGEHRGQTFNINFVRRPVALHDRGQTLTVTTYDDDADRTDGHIVNQIAYAYDGWGNVATSWQAHNGKVDNDGLDGDDSPSVQYGYDSLARLTSVTYPTDPPGAPTNRVVGYGYGDGVAGSMEEIGVRLLEEIGVRLSILSLYRWPVWVEFR